jgi:hypothetical protein
MGRSRSHSVLVQQALKAKLVTVCLLVLAIFAHALLPAGSPLQRTSGSAFSTSTTDVTTIPRRLKDQVQVEVECRGAPSNAAAGPGACDLAMAEAVRLVPLPQRLHLPTARPTSQPEGTDFASPYEARAPPLFSML